MKEDDEDIDIQRMIISKIIVDSTINKAFENDNSIEKEVLNILINIARNYSGLTDILSGATHYYHGMVIAVGLKNANMGTHNIEKEIEIKLIDRLIDRNLKKLRIGFYEYVNKFYTLLVEILSKDEIQELTEEEIKRIENIQEDTAKAIKKYWQKI